MTTTLNPFQILASAAVPVLPAILAYASVADTWGPASAIVSAGTVYLAVFAAAVLWSRSASQAVAIENGAWDQMVHALTAPTSEDRIPVKIKLLNPLASVPQNAKPGDAGFDLRSVVDVIVEPGATLVLPTGVAIEIPSDTVALVCSRSGMAAKQSVAVLNAPGVIDSGYRGELLVVLHNHGSEPFPVSVGDRIAQLMIQHYLVPHFELVDELGESERGTASVGSTGLA